MQHHLATLITLLLCTAALTAGPVRRETVCLTQPDGTTLLAMPYGDEHMHVLTDAATGECLTQDTMTGLWRAMTASELESAIRTWNESRADLHNGVWRDEATDEAAAVTRFSEVAPATGTTRALTSSSSAAPHMGDLRFPVLLVEFAGTKFTEQWGNTAYLDSLLNSETCVREIYTDSLGQVYTARSARDYFASQSNGQFRPTFDLIGPVVLDSTYAYYGQNTTSSGSDRRWKAMVTEALGKAIDGGLITGAAQWDGDDDGYVDLLCILFAGWSENQRTSDPGAIWCKEGTFGLVTAPDGTWFTRTCMTGELMWNKTFGYDDTHVMGEGIGPFVHEFSHGLGLPDFYNTGYGASYGMDAWSVMDYGCYSGHDHIPPSMTVHERMLLGWMEPDTLPSEGTVVLPPISTGHKGLILRNPANADEYLTLEYHKHDGRWDEAWATGLYSSRSLTEGLLITHVDYDEAIWKNFTPNNVASHQRCTPLPADGRLRLYDGTWDWYLDLVGDAFAGLSGVTTLDTSNPYAVWWTGDSIDIRITGIRQLESGDLEITLRNPHETGIRTVTVGEGVMDKDGWQTGKESDGTPRIRLQDGRYSIGDYDLWGRKLR